MFRAAKKAGSTARPQLEHLGFGTMNGPDGKPFKTRAGGVMKLYDLIAMATEEATKRLNEQGLALDYPEAEREDDRQRSASPRSNSPISRTTAISNYVFDLDRFTRFEGKTGPYLQYAAVRIKSILRKAEGEGYAVARPVVRSEEERQLAPAAAADARGARSTPSTSARPISSATTPSPWRRISAASTPSTTSCAKPTRALRAARLGLCTLTLASLKRMLSVLGIDVPERM